MGRMFRSPSWRTIEDLEQLKWLRHAVAHERESKLCRLVARSGFVTQQSARLMADEATRHGWKLPRIGRLGKVSK